MMHRRLVGPLRRPMRKALIPAIVAAVLVAGCSDRNSSPAAGSFTPKVRGVLTVVTSAVPSTGFWEGTPSRVTGGFEYELARDLARRFGLRSVRVKLEPFSQMVSGHLAGADLALDLITPTPARRRHLDFSDAYLDAAPTVVARAGTTIPDLETARTLRWGALRGTTFVSLVDQLIAPQTPIRTFDDDDQMLAALLGRQIDAVVFDMPYAVAIADRSAGRLRTVAQLPQGETIAAALPKGSGNVQAIDSAIQAFTADGTIAALLSSWVGPSAAGAQKSIPLLRTER